MLLRFIVLRFYLNPLVGFMYLDSNKMKINWLRFSALETSELQFRIPGTPGRNAGEGGLPQTAQGHAPDLQGRRSRVRLASQGSTGLAVAASCKHSPALFSIACFSVWELYELFVNISG